MSTADRLDAFLYRKGIQLQDLYLLNPQMKLIVEFLIMELDELRSNESEAEDADNPYYWGF